MMPPHMVNRFEKYSKDNPLPPEFTHLPYFIYFFVHFQLPWIMGWDYEFSCENSVKLVTRKISFKWWDKYHLEPFKNC